MDQQLIIDTNTFENKENYVLKKINYYRHFYSHSNDIDILLSELKKFQKRLKKNIITLIYNGEIQ
jgi:hypothetical protein